MTDVFSADTTPQLDQNTDYMAELVGEGKKFKTPAELARGKLEADRHIDNLTKTLNELRDELKTRQTTEELMNRITSLSQKPQDQNTGTPPMEDQTNKATGLTAEDVNKLLEGRDIEQRKMNNLNSAQAKLIERYGNDAAAEIERKSQELGVSRDHLKEMAKTTPSVFLALFTAPAPAKDMFAAPASGRQTQLQPTGNAGVKKFSEFQKMRRENPTEYFGRKVQADMLAIGDRLGGPGSPRYEAWKNS